MLIAISKISDKLNIHCAIIHNKIFWYGIPIKYKAIKIKYKYRGGYRTRIMETRHIDTKYVKYLTIKVKIEELQRLTEKWYEAKTDDINLLGAYEQEEYTMNKNDLMRFCIIKELI